MALKKHTGSATSSVPFSYRSGTTILHHCPAGLKLLFLLALSLAAFSSIIGLAISALLIIVGAAFAKIRPWELLRGSKPLMLLAFFVIVFKTVQMGKAGDTFISFIASFINRSGFLDGIRQGSCIIVSFSAGALLFAVTTTGELRDSLGRLENAITGFFIHKKQTAPAGKLSLGISLMLGFLPRFFELWESANLACEGRAGKKGFSRIVLLVPLVTERMMEMASETALALEGRGFTV